MKRRVLPLFGALCLSACGRPDFDPPSLVESVRLIAISADKPYAAPGDTVSMDMLAFDGRPDKAAPMRTFWVPIVCPNPPDDAYFACYPGFDAALSPGVDISAELVEGTHFSFHMPHDIITKHAPPKSGAPFGMVVVFAIACAGHVEYVRRSSDTLPPRPPLGCFDERGAELSPDDSVFAYAQVFSFAGRSNANPVLDHLTLAGEPVDPAKGITLDHCPASERKCPTTDIDAVVPATSQEPDPADVDQSGAALKEEIWVDYYVTAGGVSNGAALLYDAHRGKMPNTAVKLTAPEAAGEGMLWAVLHDNRGGVSWTPVPLHVK